MSTSSDTAVRTSIVVDAPLQRAFTVFTEGFGTWFPSAYNLMSSPIAERVFEARAGGEIYDRAVDGQECHWARVLACEPPHRVLFSWGIDPRWELETDPERCSEVEVTFVAESETRTRVELEHRHLDRHGPGWEQTRGALNSEGGWPGCLRAYAQRAADQ